MLPSVNMLSLHMFSNPDRQLLSYFLHQRPDVKTDISSERQVSQRQRGGEQSRPRQFITPAPPRLWFRGRTVKRDGVARRRGPIQTQYHLLQSDLELLC